MKKLPIKEKRGQYSIRLSPNEMKLIEKASRLTKSQPAVFVREKAVEGAETLVLVAEFGD